MYTDIIFLTVVLVLSGYCFSIILKEILSIGFIFLVFFFFWSLGMTNIIGEYIEKGEGYVQKFIGFETMQEKQIRIHEITTE